MSVLGPTGWLLLLPDGGRPVNETGSGWHSGRCSWIPGLGLLAAMPEVLGWLGRHLSRTRPRGPAGPAGRGAAARRMSLRVRVPPLH